jgi:hypothetical protein
VRVEDRGGTGVMPRTRSTTFDVGIQCRVCGRGHLVQGVAELLRQPKRLALVAVAAVLLLVFAALRLRLDAFIAGMEEQRTSGALGSLSEREIANEATVYGNLAAVRSTFVASIEGADRRGVTFATIVREQGRWLILTAAWENEDPEQPLPNHLL